MTMAASPLTEHDDFPFIDDPIDDDEDDDIDQDPRDLAILRSITSTSSLDRLLVPNYAEDTVMRRAFLDRRLWRQQDAIAFYGHGSLAAQMCVQPDGPLPLSEVQRRLTMFQARTLLTVRIAMGLWNLRHHDRSLCRNGLAPIRIDEFLEWLGLSKHTKSAGSSRRTDGWRPDHIQAIENDLRLAASLWVSGKTTLKLKAQHRAFQVDSAYIRVVFVRRQTKLDHMRLYGVFFSPGEWFDTYSQNETWFFAPVSRSIFELHPQQDQHALRMALYLVELWRRQAEKRRYDTPLVMGDLLRESVINIPTSNVYRFATRIEAALTTLYHRGIIGPFERLHRVDEAQHHVNHSWLASQWRILPPDGVRDFLDESVRPFRTRRA